MARGVRNMTSEVPRPSIADEPLKRKAPCSTHHPSLLDTDLYKFTMWQALLHGIPQTQAEYGFVCRNQPAYPLAELLTT